MTAKRTAITLGTAAAIAIAVPATAKFEGLWLVAKVDRIGTGQPPTVCYGETEGVKVGDRYTKQQCDEMLAKKLPRYNAEISECIHVPISDKTRAAFISFAYNVGSAGFCRSTAAKRLNEGNIRAACDALMQWTRAGGRVVKGLVNRRASERAMCIEGIKEPTIGPASAGVAPAKSWWRK